MSEQQNKSSNFSFYLGITGFIAGIILAFSDNYVIGIAGAVASAGLAYKAYSDKKASKN